MAAAPSPIYSPLLYQIHFLTSNHFLISNQPHNACRLHVPTADIQSNSNNSPFTNHHILYLQFYSKSNVDPIGSANRSIGTSPGPHWLPIDGDVHHRSLCAGPGIHWAMVERERERKTHNKPHSEWVGIAKGMWFIPMKCIALNFVATAARRSRISIAITDIPNKFLFKKQNTPNEPNREM